MASRDREYPFNIKYRCDIAKRLVDINFRVEPVGPGTDEGIVPWVCTGGEICRERECPRIIYIFKRIFK